MPPSGALSLLINPDKTNPHDSSCVRHRKDLEVQNCISVQISKWWKRRCWLQDDIRLKASGMRWCKINPDLNFISNKRVYRSVGSWRGAYVQSNIYLVYSSNISALLSIEQLNSTVMDTYVGLPRTLGITSSKCCHFS